MDTDQHALVEAAEAYDSLFVPALFGQWAEALAESMNLKSGMSVLDVACGTGALTTEIHQRVSPHGGVIGLDIHPGMLAVAETKFPDVLWMQGDAAELPFAENTFDVVASQFGLMFFPSPVLSVTEMLRVVKPGGRIVVAVWDDIENVSGYSTELAMIESAAGIEAGNAVRAPFCLGDQVVLRKLFEEAGAADIRIETKQGVAKFPSINIMVSAELRGWLPIMGVELEEEKIESILQSAEDKMASFKTPSGNIEFGITSHFVQAVKIDE